MKIYAYMDDIFNYIFIFEIVVKIIAFGVFFNGPSSYFKVPWNILG